jgi:ABC-type branched-subunit amino acid transport system permease subunit
LISLGQGGFMAIGAYVSAVLTKEGVPFWIAVTPGA